MKAYLSAIQQPDIQLDTIEIDDGLAYVVRDDLLQGGTKQRAAVPFVLDKLSENYTEFVYASPFCGFAQVALASACQTAGTRCTLFCERDQTFGAGQNQKHEFTKLAESFGADIHLVESLSEATTRAQIYAHNQISSFLVPLGFDCEEFRSHLRVAIIDQWRIVQSKVQNSPSHLWLPVGSGTLAKVFHSVVGREVRIRALNIRVLESNDDRLSNVSKLKGLDMIQAPEKFFERAQYLPPIASNIHYDAKIWQKLQTEGRHGDLWWNVAR